MSNTNNQENNLKNEFNDAAFCLNACLGFKVEGHTALCYLYYQRNYFLTYGCESNDKERLKVVREWKCSCGNN